MPGLWLENRESKTERPYMLGSQHMMEIDSSHDDGGDGDDDAYNVNFHGQIHQGQSMILHVGVKVTHEVQGNQF